jgi:hypothetical protein
MKQFTTICVCVLINFATAQNLSFPTRSFEFHPEKFPKATVYLESDSSIQGIIMKITESILVLSAYANDTAKNKSFFDIPITQIKKVRIKTDISLSMAGGAVLTGLVGYGLGYLTYDHDNSLSDEDNKDNAQLRGALGALIAAVPGAFIGMVTGLFHQQNFVINGDNKKMKRLMKALR